MRLYAVCYLAIGLSCCPQWLNADEPNPDDPSRPNVILILTDDQGYGDLSFHGNPVIKTPHLDRFARQSIRLTDFHVAPMCTPTRGQLMTGVDALRNGAMNVSSGRSLLRQEFPTMANIFAESEYHTGIFGKWHLGDNYPYRPHDRGFEEALYFPCSLVGSAPDYWNNDYFNDHYRRQDEVKSYQGYCTDVWFNEAMSWMKQRQESGEPFFCYIPTNAPHGPLFVPENYRQPYEALSSGHSKFYGMIANIDENMGRLEAMLQETGLRENTIVIFMTDNGTAHKDAMQLFNAGMRGRKISLYEGGHRVPCFIRWPAGDLKNAGEVAELTQVQDILPTLVDLCSLKTPENWSIDGTSLASLLQGKAERLPERMFVIQFSRMPVRGQKESIPTKGEATVAWHRWRLVNQDELYDLKTDPGQTKNVSDQHPEITKKMQSHYDNWWAGIAPTVNEFSPIHIGSSQEPISKLSPSDWQDVFLDTSFQVRSGLPRNGVWNLYVEKAGEYSASLARWPAEAKTSIRAGTAAHHGEIGSFPAGKALPIVSARICIAEHDQTQPVREKDRSIEFRLSLAAGPTQLQTWFLDKDHQELCGAYYVVIQRIRD